MSFQDFQKSRNRLTSREVSILILVVFVALLLLYGLAVGNYYLANLLPDSGEFSLLRTGGRSFLFDQIEPYSSSVPEQVQRQVYGGPAVKGEDLYILDMPFHLLMLFFPLALFPDASVARAFWMALSEIALAASIYFCFRIMGRRVPYFFVGLISIACFTSFYSFRSFFEGSTALILGLVYVGISISLRSDYDELAGALMVLSAFQWEVGGLFLFFVALWVFWEKRWRVFTSAGMLTFILLVISFLWYPGWLLPFLRASWNSFRAGFGYSVHDILGRLWPQLGSTLGWVLTAFLIVGLAYEWRAVRRANFDRFLWAICLTIAISPLLGFPVEMDQLAPLMLPVMLVIIVARERWLKLGNGVAFLVLLFFFGVPWLLFTQGVPQAFPLRVDEILFLFWPIFIVIGLYWMRWWMVRPPRTWLDGFAQKQRS